MRRHYACSIIVVVAALMAAAVQGAPNPALLKPPDVKPTLNSVSIGFSTNVRLKTKLEVGTDKSYGLVLPDGGIRPDHLIQVKQGLEPATHYYYRIVSGKRVLYSGDFWTQPVHSADAQVSGQCISLNGACTFMLMAEYPTCLNAGGKDHPDDVAKHVYMGVNLLVSNGWVCNGTGDWQQLHALINNRVWYQPDNGDEARLADLPELLDVWDTSLLNTDSGLDYCGNHSTARLYDSLRQQEPPAIYQLYLADQRANGPSCLDPQREAATFYTALTSCRVAAMDYYTARTRQANLGFNVLLQIQEQTRRQDAQAATLGPVLMTPCLRAKVTTAGSPIRVAAHRLNGVTYALVVNTSDKAAKGRIVIPGIGQRQVAVRIATTVNESTSVNFRGGRRLKAKANAVSDRFGPLATHLLYVVQ